LLALINDILELSQLEAGKAILNINEFSLVQLAQASVCSHNISYGESLYERAKHQAINLKLDLKIEPPSFRFAADPQRVRQILWNLVSNAVKFTPEGGQVSSVLG
jgi:signal transduction histidine kinase